MNKPPQFDGPFAALAGGGEAVGSQRVRVNEPQGTLEEALFSWEGSQNPLQVQSRVDRLLGGNTDWDA